LLFLPAQGAIVRLWLAPSFCIKKCDGKKATVAWVCGEAKKYRGNVSLRQAQARAGEHSGFFCCDALC